MARQIIILLLIVVPLGCTHVKKGSHAGAWTKNWQRQIEEVTYVSSGDGSAQPALCYMPRGSKPVPLLVGLHTWSGNYTQARGALYAQWCIDRGWAFIHPNFRGPNNNPDATGSELVVQDIISAVNYAKTRRRIDESRIYLVGCSGGGYAALLMAGRVPDIWAGVSAWVPISDLNAWYQHCKNNNLGYADQIVASCGGVPDSSPEADSQYAKRSAITYLARASRVKLDINAGIYDGHTGGGSVPISQSLYAFNMVCMKEDRLLDDDIAYFVEKQAVPPALRVNVVDKDYGKKRPLFRLCSGNARLTIFKGGHEIVYDAALKWLAKQRK